PAGPGRALPPARVGSRDRVGRTCPSLRRAPAAASEPDEAPRDATAWKRVVSSTADMPHEIVMPRLGWSTEEGILVEWLKKDGDSVRSGDTVCVIESDKAQVEVESFDAGTLRIPADSPGPGVSPGISQRFLASPCGGNGADGRRSGRCPGRVGDSRQADG